MTTTNPAISSEAKRLSLGAPAFVIFALAVFALSGCAAQKQAAAMAPSPAAAGQQTFATPEEASAALSAAWHADSTPGLMKVFGPDGVRLVSSGDDVADKKIRTRLASAYDTQHKIKQDSEQQATLILGEEEFPFPIPLVKYQGAWHFDTKAGQEEILNRRIGRNELNAIKVCQVYVESQRDYAADRAAAGGVREYAMRITSTDDQHDGLYWPAKPGEPESPFGPMMASAAAEGYGVASADILSPFHGYYYKILTRQGSNAPGGAQDYVVNGHMTGGFALVAFPAQYGASGIMTFIVNQDGVVFQKNLGSDTASIARQMAVYDPDQTWKPY